MPERILPIIDSIFMTLVSLGLFITTISFLTAIPTLLASLFWMGKLKKIAEKEHGGSIFKYIMYLLKKN